LSHRLLGSADEDEAGNYRGCGFPREIIGHGVWPNHRFCLSFQDAEELLTT